MLDLQIDTSALRAAWATEIRNLERGCELAVEVAGKAGEDVARSTVPVRSGALRDSIRFRPGGSSARGATGVLEALERHASWINDGTPAHVIAARRRKALRFEASGGVVFARKVSHPGTAPVPFMTDAFGVVEIRLVRAGENVANAVCARMNR